MTTIPITLTHKPEHRRDGYGRYLIVPPNGTKPVGYTRVTTVAKSLDDGGALGPWLATMAAGGIIMHRGLRSRWEALLAQYGDPWYGGQEAKAACKALVEECAAVGGANSAKDVGSSLHAMTALIDVGRPPKHLTPETEADLEAYVRGMKAANVQVLDGMVELTVVLDNYQVAGTFDRLVTVPGFDVPLIADIKTGQNLEYSWQSVAVQLAGYAHGDCIYEQGADKKGSQDRRYPMPEVDQEFAVVIWLKAGTGEMELWLVDIQKGWAAFELSMQAREWRKYEPAAPFTTEPITADPGNAGVLLRQSLAAATVPDVAGRDVPTTHIEMLDGEMGPQAVEVSGPAHPQPQPRLYRDWLQGRIDTIGRHDTARADLMASWPKSVPSLNAAHDHDEAALLAIEQLLVTIEARHRIAFPEPRPTLEEQEAAAEAIVVNLFPGAEAVPNDNDHTKGST